MIWISGDAFVEKSYYLGKSVMSYYVRKSPIMCEIHFIYSSKN